MKEKSYYTIYKITNKLNGKIYIGKHITDNPNDDYYGSGTLIIQEIEKYGKENFTKEILFIFNNKIEMDKKEKELVNEDFIKREDTYNLVLGGHGGGREPGYIPSDETKRKLSEAMKKYYQEHPYTKEKRLWFSQQIKKRNEEHPEISQKKAIGSKQSWNNPEIRKKRIEGQKRWHREVGLSEEQLNKMRVPHSPEWSAKISQSLKGKHKSQKHRQHLSQSRKGRIRVYNETTKKWKYIWPSDPMPKGFSKIPIGMRGRG